MFEPLLEGILAASGDPAKAVAWLIDLSQSTGDPLSVLGRAARNQSLPDVQRDILYQKLVDAHQAKVAASFGQPREIAEQGLRSWQTEWLRFLIARKQADRALALLDSIPPKTRKTMEAELVPLEIQIAGLSNAVPALLARYAADREPPAVESLRNGANELARRGMDDSSRRVLEFVYARELEAHHFDEANFLGLAEIRLREGQTPAANDLLRRMTMLSGEPFDTQSAAASLLARFGKNAEAAAFADQRVKAVPWDAEARAKLAELTRNVRELSAVASNPNAAYGVRASAAVAIRSNGGAALTTGSAELDLLASATPFTEASVNRPYWYRARVEAAAAINDGASRIRILLAAIATDPAPAEPRLQLFRTAMDLKRYQQAIAAMPPAGGQGSESGSDSAEFPEWQVSMFLQNTPYTAADRAFVARGLGEAYQRLNDPPRAVYYYRLAMELDKSPTLRAAIQPNLDATRRAVSLKRSNAQRRPVVSRNLEQPQLVRPKLTSGGAQ